MSSLSTSRLCNLAKNWLFFVAWSKFPQFLKRAPSWKIIAATLRKLNLHKGSRDIQIPGAVLTQDQAQHGCAKLL